MIHQQLQNKTSTEKANIKGQEIARVAQLGKIFRQNYDIEILEIQVIPNGIEIFARAWKNDKQIGFGKDGSIDIERFRIFNPPILVDDSNGDIVREWTDEITGKLKQRKLREDPQEALLQSLEHTVLLVGKDGSNIVKGKIGNTTSTFYSDTADAGPSIPNQATFAAAREATSVTDVGTSAIDFIAAAERETTGSDFNVARGFFPFDASAIPDTDTISSATLTFTVAGGENKQTAGVTLGTLASPPTYASGDFDGITLNSPAEGTDARVDTNVAVDSTFDFVLNATGISWISKTTWTTFCVRYTGDIDNVTPPNSTRRYTQVYYADQAGTANDPKLVVVHASVVTSILQKPTLLLMGV